MIITSNFIVTGSISNFPALYTNNMIAPDMSNITIHSDINVTGVVKTPTRMDVGSTIFATFRAPSNINFSGSNEIVGLSNQLIMDQTGSDMSAMSASNIPMVIAPFQVYNATTGVITVPISGFYSLSMQGSFSNSTSSPPPINGVYYRFLNHSHSNARVAPVLSSSSLVSTSAMKFLLAGDTLLPTFYSSDPNATLVGTAGETFVGFTVLATVAPTHSNYYRV